MHLLFSSGSSADHMRIMQPKKKLYTLEKKNLHSTWLIKQLKAELVHIKSEEITTLNYKNKLTLFYFITSGEPINL